MTLFKKAAVFGDIHFGMRNNSQEHNEHCSKYVDWFIAMAKEHGCETCIFVGDWHHIRSNVNVSTLNYSIDNLKKINDAFDHSYFIVGNHDLYYKNSRELNSLPFTSLFDNISLYSELTEIDGVTFLPWLVNDEWVNVSKLKSKYLFGHLELPKFKMNAMVEMPDHGELQTNHLEQFDYVFTGHFHKRQTKGNVFYIGNPFPHNFADAWDDERGMMILEWDGEPEFYNYLDGPKFRTIGLGHLLTDPKRYLDKNTYAKVTIDTAINFEEMNFLKKVFSDNLGVQEFVMIPERSDDVEGEFDGEIEFETIDQIVVNQLYNVESKSYKPTLLVEMYKSLDV